MEAASDHAFRALADPTRRKLFERLSREGGLTVSGLTNGSGVSQPAVSKHLAVLKRARLVEDRREGRETRYQARPEGLSALVDWLGIHAAFWGDRFDKLEDLLNCMDQ